MDELIKKAQDGDAEAIEYILNNSRKDIHFWAKRYDYIRGVDYEDIFQEGLIAVWIGLKKYKLIEGCSFRSFASKCIRNSMCVLIVKNNAQKRRIANCTTYVNDIGRFGNSANIEKRIIEAQKLGFKKIIIPEANEVQEKIKGIEIIKVKRIIEAITKSLAS